MCEKMRITMSYSGGTYRGIQLASAFHEKGILERIFIPFYSQKWSNLTRIFGRGEDRQVVSVEKVETNLKVCILRKILHKTRRLRRVPKARDRYRVGDMFDKWVSKQITDRNTDIIIAESHQALHTIRKAKELGIVTFLDRTNSHIRIQERIDSDELKRLGMKPWHDNRDIERGLDEYEEADFIIAPSAFVKNGFVKEGISAEKILCVSPGIDLTYFDKIPKNDDVFRVIYCGGISHRKGIMYLLEAIASLKLKNSEVWLIGGVADGMMNLLAKYEGLYKIINFVANYELYKYFSQGSIFVLPSLEDSFGKVIVEAMACGLPAIVTTNTAAGDVVREGKDGFVVPVKNVKSLMEKILYLYNNSQICKDMGNSAMKRVREEFTLNAYAERMISSLKKCV